LGVETNRLRGTSAKRMTDVISELLPLPPRTCGPFGGTDFAPKGKPTTKTP
jgi:hypothetical protein